MDPGSMCDVQRYVEPSGAAVRRFERSLQNNIYYVKGSGSSHMALYLVFIDCSSAKGIQFNSVVERRGSR